MQKTKILWSGITGRTGLQAQIASKDCDFAEIVAGICRSDSKFYNYSKLDKIKEKYDVIVDFSHKDSFDKMLNFALRVKKPLIIGTAGLSEQQIKAFQDASEIIPIYGGGNFRFAVEKFIDDVVDYAAACKGKIKLVETHYKTKKIPSETAKVIAKRVLEKTNKVVDIESHLEYDEPINDWRVDNLHCRVYGFEELGKDVLKIASMMIDPKPGLYDLKQLLKKQFEISPSLDPANVDNNLENYLGALNKIDDISIHLDVMRNDMVGHDHCTKQQFDYAVKNSKHPVDVHLMGTDPELVTPNARSFCVHNGDPMIAWNADKTVAIVMSVKPGLSGQSFMPDAIERIKNLRKECPGIRIIVDGGINDKNIALVHDAGANVAVVGNYLYSIYKQSGQTGLSQAVLTLADIARK
ncbi:MAG: hypothetical protein LBG88_01810 [Christensenellaceae bacterium]|nr:hypothetical protein [Christensenellaceae bacterium]